MTPKYPLMIFVFISVFTCNDGVLANVDVSCPSEVSYPCAGTGKNENAINADRNSLAAVGGVYHTIACNKFSSSEASCDPTIPSEVDYKPKGRFSGDFPAFPVGPKKDGTQDELVDIKKRSKIPFEGSVKGQPGVKYSIYECTYRCTAREIDSAVQPEDLDDFEGAPQ